MSGDCRGPRVHFNDFLAWIKEAGGTIGRTDAGLFAPTLFLASCRQCNTKLTIIVYAGPDGPDVAILWSVRGGLRTPATPAGVTYYLDQAARCEALGARSAAVAMYRGALEQLLHEQGYKGMLNAKITALEKNLTDKTGPDWIHRLKPDFLRVLKDLGNGAIHPNDGDITRQQAFDTELLIGVRVTMEMLLELVYEQPGRDARLLQRLQTSAAMVAPPPKKKD